MYKKLNYATGVLSAGISDSATEVVLKAGHTITTETGEANKFVGVFFDKAKSSPFHDVNREIVEAYRTNTNVFTIARAKEGTDAKAWVEDDNFMLIASSAVFNEYENELNNKQDVLGFTPENVANKKTTITDSDVDYPTCKAVNTGLSGKQDALGFTPENVANKLTSFQGTPDDTHYPSEKLVKDSLDAKAPLASPTLTGTVTLPKAVNVKDTSADHEYQLGVSELAANRTVTLPLLTGDDEFVFKAHTQTLTNKRINPRIITATSYTTDTGTSLNVDNCDQFVITAQAGALKFNNPGGTPLNGQKLVIRIKDNGTARALTYDTQFRGIGVELPDTTVAGKTLYMGFIYNSNDTKWDLVAITQE